MKRPNVNFARALRASTRALPVLLIGALGPATHAPRASAATPPSTRGPIATVGNRTVDALDIQRAATVLAADPLLKQNPARWRRMLLDRCVDRELLSMEAERLGLQRERAVREKITEREYQRLYREVHEKFLLPGVNPTKAELDSLRQSGLYKWMDLHYIFIRDDTRGGRRSMAERILAQLRAGTRFDSLARLYSEHNSRGNGGHFGPVLVRDLTQASHADVRASKQGDVLGPYSGPNGHEIFKVGGFVELAGDSLARLVRRERLMTLVSDYEARLLDKYHHALERSAVAAALTAARTETPDSIMASLGPDGTRPQRGTRPALGVIARVDGDSITFGEFYRAVRPLTLPSGFMFVENEPHLRTLTGHAFYKRLVVRDAKERGIADEPLLARELRLIRDETATDAMVERARLADPDLAGLRAFFDSRATRYQRPAAWLARVAVFESRDSALAALREWNGKSITDSSLGARGLIQQPGATAATLVRGRTAVLTIFDGDPEPLGLALRTLQEGQLAPVVETLHGFAVAQLVAREAARPYAFEEVIDRVRRDWREEVENEWVLKQLERMRATTPVRVIPARLEAVNLGPAKGAQPRTGAKLR
jgi:hypothetical protein